MKTTTELREPEPGYATERWFQLLKAACAQHGAVKVAGMLGYRNHTGTSQVLAGKYAGQTARFAARVLQVFDVLVCPHSGQSITPAACRATHSARAPLHNPMKMIHWRACQQCPNREEA